MYKICKVCPNCYNENFYNCDDGDFACVECGRIYDNVMQLEDMDFECEDYIYEVMVNDFYTDN